MAVINAKRSLACNSRLARSYASRHAARAPAQSDDSDFRCRRSEIAELRPELRPGQATTTRGQRPGAPETQSGVVQTYRQRILPLSACCGGCVVGVGTWQCLGLGTIGHLALFCVLGFAAKLQWAPAVVSSSSIRTPMPSNSLCAHTHVTHRAYIIVYLSRPHVLYCWIGHKPGSGLSDLAPSILHYNWF
jgi:hypothetical protein